jgi:hypothetical protein
MIHRWERDLNTADVESICKYATCHLRGWVDNCKKLNQKAGSLVVEGLHSCGWDGHSHHDTALMKCLAHHVLLQNLPPVPAEHEEAQTRKRNGAQEEASSSKRHCHNTEPEANNGARPLAIDSVAGRWDVSYENQSARGSVDTTLDWDFSINLDLDWDQFIEDQITESMIAET